MLIIFGVTLTSVVIYTLLIYLIQKSWIPKQVVVTLPNDLPFVSVIIAARNEESNINDCLRSLELNHYPKNKFEVIVIDDMSNDQTGQVVLNNQSENVKLYRLKDVTTQGSKKQALAFASQNAKGTIWMYTDADCVVNPQWIRKCVSAFHTHPNTKVILGPVSHQNPLSSLLSKWQQLDIMGMMAVTQAGIERRQWYIGNGANLAIKADLWEKVGYELNSKHQHASGDDVTLVQGAAKLDQQSLHYLLDQDYIVNTLPEPNLKSLLLQRLRWTSKNNEQSSISQKVVMAVTWLFCVWTLIMGILSVSHWYYAIAFLLLIVSKALIDTVYLSKIQSFFDSKISKLRMTLLSPLHTLYVAGFGLLALFPQRYSWKGRKVK